MSNKPISRVVRRRVSHPATSEFASPKAVTQQHLREASDINGIVARARRGIAPTNVRPPGRFADVSDSPESLTEAFLSVDRAITSFNELPALARDELGNDPRRLLEASPEFMLRHGLVTRAEVDALREASQEPAKAPEPKARTASPAAPSLSPKGKPEAAQGDD